MITVSDWAAITVHTLGDKPVTMAIIYFVSIQNNSVHIPFALRFVRWYDNRVR